MILRFVPVLILVLLSKEADKAIAHVKLMHNYVPSACKDCNSTCN